MADHRKWRKEKADSRKDSGFGAESMSIQYSKQNCLRRFENGFVTVRAIQEITHRLAIFTLIPCITSQP